MDEAATLAFLRRLAAVVVSVTISGCATVDGGSIERGLDEVLITQPLKKRSDPVSKSTSPSSLRATPSQVDFGTIQVASDNQRRVKIFNPHHFAVTVVHVSVQGCGFELLAGGDERYEVAARSELILAVAFRPVEQRTCSGALLLEVDSAVGRLTRVPLRGTGT